MITRSRSEPNTRTLEIDPTQVERLHSRLRREKERQDHLRRLGMAQQQQQEEIPPPMNNPQQERFPPPPQGAYFGIGNQGNQPFHLPREEPRIGEGDEPRTNSERMGIRPPPIRNNNFEIKSSLINMVQNARFFGLALENPLEHLDNFERLCGTVKINGVGEDVIRLTLFPFSLGDKASQWEKSVVTSTITTWDECKRRFLAKFFSPQRTAKIRNEISTFKQGGLESLYEAWERFNGYIRSCPHHGITKGNLLQIFHRGIHEKYRLALNTASMGSFASLSADQGEKLIENLAQSDHCDGEEYDRTGRSVVSKDDKIRELSEKVDKLILQTKRSVHFVEADIEEGQEGDNQEEVSYIQGSYYQKPFNQGYKPFNNNLSYRSTNVENPQDQVYPSKTNQQGWQYQPKAYFQKPQQQQTGLNKEEETHTLLKKLLEGQNETKVELNKKLGDINVKIESMYRDINIKHEALASHVKVIDAQLQQVISDRKGKGLPKEKGEASKDFCNAILEEINPVTTQPWDDIVFTIEEEKIINDFENLFLNPHDVFDDSLSMDAIGEPEISKGHAEIILGFKEESAQFKKEFEMGDTSLAKEGVDFEEEKKEPWIDKEARKKEVFKEAKESESFKEEEKLNVSRKEIFEKKNRVSRQMPKEEEVSEEDFPVLSLPVLKATIPYPQRFKKQILEAHYKDLKKKGLLDIPKEWEEEAKTNEDIKRKLENAISQREKVEKIMRDNGIPTTRAIQKTLEKSKEEGRFVVPCAFKNFDFEDALADTGASLNVISLDRVKELGLQYKILNGADPILLGDASKKSPMGRLEDIELRVNNTFVKCDFVVMDTKGNQAKFPTILGTPFLITTGASIDFDAKELILKKVDDGVSYPMLRTKRESDFCGTIYQRGTKKKRGRIREEKAYENLAKDGVLNLLYGEILEEEEAHENLAKKEKILSAPYSNPKVSYNPHFMKSKEKRNLSKNMEWMIRKSSRGHSNKKAVLHLTN